MEQLVLKDDLRIIYVTANSFPAGIQQAFDTLEGLIGGRKNRTFFGLSKPQRNEIVYMAGVSEAYEGEAKQYNSPVFILQKGTYLTQLVPNFMQHISAIGTTFQKLLDNPALDKSSYCVEWYKGNDVLCMVKLND